MQKIGFVVIAFLFLVGFASTDADADGEVKSLKDFQYWDNGKVRQCTIYDAGTGRLKGKVSCAYDGAIDRTEKFDERGNRIEAALYDGKGNLKLGVDGWAAMRWRYDDSHLVWQISYDEYGRPIERKFYSESGKLAMRLYRDDDKVNPYVNAAMYTMLGAQNAAYYDSRATFDEMTGIMRE